MKTQSMSRAQSIQAEHQELRLIAIGGSVKRVFPMNLKDRLQKIAAWFVEDWDRSQEIDRKIRAQKDEVVAKYGFPVRFL